MTSGRSMSMASVGERPQGFFHSKRGCSKHRCNRRKVVWDLLGDLVRQGHTADGGMDRIYAVYCGQTSVSNIISGLKRDKKWDSESQSQNIGTKWCTHVSVKCWHGWQ
jgi:hypothetical protein